jgi:hypothetical protein
MASDALSMAISSLLRSPSLSSACLTQSGFAVGPDAITVLDTNGNTIGTSSVALQPNSKTEATLDGLPGLNGMVGNRGSAQFTVSTGNVAVLGLRFVGGGAFTSIPAAQH